MDANTIYPFNTEREPGARCQLGKTFTEVDNSLFAGVTGNLSPVYMDEHHCRAVGLEGRLLFEGLIAGLACAAAAELTGGGFRLENLAMNVLSPSMIGATYHAEATMISNSSDLCEIAAKVFNPDTEQAVATVDLRYKRL